MKIRIGFALLVLTLLLAEAGYAASKAGVPASAGAGVQTSEKALEVKGQNRNLAMLQGSNTEKTKIGFVKPRRNFRQQVLTTVY